MGTPRSVTALAIDPLWQLLGEDRSLNSCIALGISVVAEHALPSDSAAQIYLALPVIARAHRPIAGALRVPAHWKLNQLSIRRAMQVTPRVIARADHIVDPLFHHVRLFAVEPGRRPPLKE